MKIPLILRIAALVVAATAFYTYVGQLVPQKEVYPPAEVEMKANMSTDEMVEAGRQVMEGKGLCFTCHTVGKQGALRFPDLQGIGGRAATRIPGMGDLLYLEQSLYEPDTFIVPGFSPGMPVINKAPIGLTDQEILVVIATLQSMGGTPTVTMETKLAHAAGGGGAAPPPPAAAPAAADPLRDFGCTGCHGLDGTPAGGKKGPSLDGIGEKMDAAAIASALVRAHAETNQNLTLGQIRALARELAAKSGS